MISLSMAVLALGSAVAIYFGYLHVAIVGTFVVSVLFMCGLHDELQRRQNV